MASIAKRPDGRWRARYRDDAGKEHARHFDRKVDAQRWLDEVTASVLTGQYVDPKAGKVTFGAYAAAWQARQVHRANTRAAVDSALRVHALPIFGNRPMASIRPSEIQAWVQHLSTKVAPSTVQVTYQHLRAVFRAAADDRVIAQSPCRRITLPLVEHPQILLLETSAVLELEAAMPARWRAIVLLMAGTGLRPGEAAGLTVDRVDFLRRTLRVDRQLMLTWPPTFGPPKTKASYRTIPLPQTVVDALAAHLADFPAGDQGAIFTEPGGGLLYRDHVTRAFRKAVNATSAPVKTRLHDLRHYYASLLIRHGESVKVVQARLGHGSAKETLDTYAHIWPDSEDLTRTAVDDVLGAAADSTRTEGAQ
ncbi:site-specific integrase [Nocardioides psychrotolerans]|uniref:Site-specific recombinase XerD n=1 Tax=Nocardioides psychrotolerans TaxID=1005945 RepID=A0A1I3MD21_9ACTN|nr:site-specific integrase [Nocardioides psychrotolerans]GEP40597.1 site-specific integrase [Nocardioides psychrotolerans]SFI94615.1 Site-specific recombinase XerD [Nocardioides psychrotolerans]